MADKTLTDMKIPGAVRDTFDEVRAGLSSMKFGDLMPDIDIGKVDLSKTGSRVVDALPRRAGPSPAPFMIGGVLLGMMLGLWLATWSVTGSRIRTALDEVRSRTMGMINGDADDDYVEPQAFPSAERAPIIPSYNAERAMEESGVPVGPGELPDGMGKDRSTV